MQYMLSNSEKFLAKDKGENQHQTPILDGVSLHYTTPGFPRRGEMLTVFIHRQMALAWQLATLCTENSSFLGLITFN